jgi:hypothetical protein
MAIVNMDKSIVIAAMFDEAEAAVGAPMLDNAGVSGLVSHDLGFGGLWAPHCQHAGLGQP